MVALGIFEKSDKQRIEVASCSLSELFNAVNRNIPQTNISGTLSIPEYQRPYVWKEKELKKLLKDVEAYQSQASDDKPLYYLGSLILHRDKKNKLLNLIDGQQRIITILLWYSMQEEAFDYPLTVQSPLSISRIQKNARYLKEYRQRPNLHLDDFNVTLIVTQNEDDAYTFFETQNTGGIRLSGADIIKSHHLRAIESTALVNRSAEEWERLQRLPYIIDMMAKARHWDYLFWRDYPSFRKKKQLKEAIVGEFTERTKKEKRNISYRQVELTDQVTDVHVPQSQSAKSVRQPLYDGLNVIQYFREMVDCYESVFVSSDSNLVDREFYLFRDQLIRGANGTIFLKEFFELSTLMYINKFGYTHLYEFALWAFRYIYSKRVSNDRTVRENSIFKLVREHRILDAIANAYTHEALITFLEAFEYKFSDKNLEVNNVKGRYIISLGSYFSDRICSPANLRSAYDSNLTKAIYAKLEAFRHREN